MPDDFNMTPVQSSQLSEVGYHEPSKRLAIKFKTGGTYHYANVTAEQHKSLVGAKSVGSHFYKHIKPHTDKHPFTKQ